VDKTNAVVAEAAEKVASLLFAKIVEAKLYVWNEETIPKNKKRLQAKPTNFWRALKTPKTASCFILTKNLIYPSICTDKWILTECSGLPRRLDAKL